MSGANVAVVGSGYAGTVVAASFANLGRLTEWPEFLAVDIEKLTERMRGRVFVDGRNTFDPETVSGAGLRYDTVGRPGPEVRASVAP